MESFDSALAPRDLVDMLCVTSEEKCKDKTVQYSAGRGLGSGAERVTRAFARISSAVYSI